MKTAKGLVDYAKAMLGLPYWYGTYGQIGSEALFKAKRNQYPSQYDKWSKSSFVSQYGKKVHDCSGLIKGYLMTAEDSANYPYNPATYNDRYDYSANGMLAQCKEQGDYASIPEIAGLLVWKSNHVGIYIGNGVVIEDKGHNYGVVKTTDTKWLKWGKLPWIDYGEQPAPTPAFCSVNMPVLSKGMKCNEVSLLQLLLRDQGFVGKDGKPLAIDRSFGGNTLFAVMSFQQAHGLTIDGVVGEATWKVLVKISYS